MTKAQKKKLREKKNKFLQKITEQIQGGDVDESQAGEIAEKWMEIADVDGSGTIDQQEFNEFISKLDGDATTDQMKDIFDSIDEDNSGELSVEEFGKALHAFITKAGGEDSDAE